MSGISWLPLESNPDVMNNFIDNLGVTKEWRFFDVFGFEDELLQFIPKPVVALILLFPISEVEPPSEQACEEPITGDQPTFITDGNVYFMRQTIQNACGAIAILHAVANNADVITFTPDSSLKQFIERTKRMSPEEKAEILTSTPEINNTHQDCAQTGQTEAPDPNAPIDLHFIALVHVNGVLYEMDGRKRGPINHGPSSPATFLNDAIRVCRQYISRSPNCLKFTAVSLSKAEQ